MKRVQRKWILRTCITLAVVGLLFLLRYGVILYNMMPDRVLLRETYINCTLRPDFPIPQSAIMTRGEDPKSNAAKYRWAAMEPAGVVLPEAYLDVIESWGWEPVDRQDEFFMPSYSFVREGCFVHIQIPNTMHQEMGAFYLEVETGSP